MRLLLAVGWLAWVLQSEATAALSFEREVRPILAKYCFDCHDDDTQKGGVNLAQFKDAGSLLHDPKMWETAIRQLGDHAMPPREKAQPEATEQLLLLENLRDLIEHPDPRLVPVDPGSTRPQRLSRTEYNFTVRDLLGVTNQPADSFPPDGGGGGGFDNNADTLFLPPVLFERYLLAAEDILAAAHPDRLLRVQPVWYRLDQRVAADNLRWFLRRAWRREVSETEVNHWLQPYRNARKTGVEFLPALKTSYKAALVSPSFVFRTTQVVLASPLPTHQPPARSATNNYPRLDDFALASRLSYFLWASMPDDALLDAAGQGRLREASGVEREVHRMLADPKARALSELFAGQWLGTRNLAAKSSPDAQKFPEYNSELRDAMIREPVEFFGALLRDRNSLLRLLDADFTFANAVLARHYGLTNFGTLMTAQASDAFVRVTLPDRSRGGVVTMAAVLTQTSYPRRTSPVLRGKWLLEEILGTPPPPPPPLVATLPQDDQVRDDLTFRQRLEKHREKKACSGCHSRMDPLGFALEHYDGVGRWRTEINGRAVDAAGVLVSGETVDGAVQLKDALLVRKDQFVRHLTEKLLAYALGRGLEYYDVPAVREIMRRTEAANYEADAWVVAVATSFPFSYQRAM